MGKTAVVWFRNDLRIHDNPALFKAAELNDEVVPLFIWSPSDSKDWKLGSASRWWLHQSLLSFNRALKKQLNLNLVIRQGSSRDEMLKFVRSVGAKRVLWNQSFEPEQRMRDLEVEQLLRKRGCAVEIFNASLLFEPKLLNQLGRPYQTFTPFFNACLNRYQVEKPLPIPRHLRAAKFHPVSLNVEDLGLITRTHNRLRLSKEWLPGCVGASQMLKKLRVKAIHYGKTRDFPELETSKLSPYLNFGEISVRTVWNSFVNRNRRKAFPLLRQLLWRDFAYYLLFHFPDTPNEEMKRKFRNFRWLSNSRFFNRWKEGKTGYPIVDAGMRELLATGWMHNRIRMIAASFLIKDLLISWKKGARWFWEMLVDANLANNTLGWQWVAGTGVDSAPYFRIFNPVRQGEKYDPYGNYVRKWIPELRRLPNKWIHRPWSAPIEVLRQSGIVLGKDYPKPVVDHEFARRRALKSYEAL